MQTAVLLSFLFSSALAVPAIRPVFPICPLHYNPSCQCDTNYKPVCGIGAVSPGTTFDNLCLMEKYNKYYTVVNEGECEFDTGGP